MRKILVSLCLLAGCIVLLPATLASQEVIHALTGTISAISPTDKTITVFEDSGARAVFAEMVNRKTAISFDKKVEAESTAATAFDKQGAYAIVFYYGDGDNQTAVAVKNLGPGPFSSATGAVVKLDSRSITLKESSGAEHTYRIDADSVAESYAGAIPGSKFQADTGDQVHVVSSNESGEQVALFLHQM